MSTPSLRSPGALAWGAVFLAVLAWSAIGPKDRLTWWLEVAPALGFFAVLAATRARFPLTPLLYVLVLGHSITQDRNSSGPPFKWGAGETGLNTVGNRSSRDR